MKKLLALFAALFMLLAVTACSGTSEPENPDNASELWAEEKMAGVVHDGYAIQAGSASDEQLLYAAVYQCYPFQAIEGAEHLSRFALYVPNTGSDGVTWYAPVYVCLPYDEQEDTASYADYATAYSEYGQVRMMATALSMTPVEKELDELREELGWKDLEDVELLLNYGLLNRLEADGRSFSDEGVSCGSTGNQALGAWRVTDENGGEERVFYLISAVGTDGAGNVAVVIVEIHIPASMAEDSEEMAVWSEIYGAYELEQWLE